MTNTSSERSEMMISNRYIDAIKSAELIVRTLLEIKPGEEVVIIIDPETDMEMAQALAGVIQTVGAEYTIAIMPTRPVERSLTMPKFIEKGLESANVIIGMTKASAAAIYSPVISRLRKENGLRELCMVLRDLDNWTKGGATADYHEVMKTAKKLFDKWEKGKEFKLTSKKGTNLTAKIGIAPPFIEAGFAKNPGEEAAFSDGEVSQGLIQGTAEGIIYVDGPIAHIGQPATPIRIEVKGGRAVKIEGDEKGARQLREIVTKVKDADNLAEIGIGVNPNCLKNGQFQEEKKSLGNVHIALGRNTGAYGGNIASMVHLDMVIYEATVKTNTDTLLSDGKLCV
jgi:leucyl aminopeptidase (aminopeptidase T)